MKFPIFAVNCCCLPLSFRRRREKRRKAKKKEKMRKKSENMRKKRGNSLRVGDPIYTNPIKNLPRMSRPLEIPLLISVKVRYFRFGRIKKCFHQLTPKITIVEKKDTCMTYAGSGSVDGLKWVQKWVKRGFWGAKVGQNASKPTFAPT